MFYYISRNFSLTIFLCSKGSLDLMVCYSNLLTTFDIFLDSGINGEIGSTAKKIFLNQLRIMFGCN